MNSDGLVSTLPSKNKKKPMIEPATFLLKLFSELGKLRLQIGNLFL
jgi:hypothetical protein